MCVDHDADSLVSAGPNVIAMSSVVILSLYKLGLNTTLSEWKPLRPMLPDTIANVNGNALVQRS